MNQSPWIDPELPLIDLHRHLDGAIRLETVLEVETEQPDIISAMNFSYWLLQDRASLKRYFTSVRKALKTDGVFFLDAYGGYDSYKTIEEPRALEGVIVGLGEGDVAVVDCVTLWIANLLLDGLDVVLQGSIGLIVLEVLGISNLHPIAAGVILSALVLGGSCCRQVG